MNIKVIKIPPAEIVKRMKQLMILLEQWKYERYYLLQENIPLEIYDQYFEELIELEKRYNFSFPETPTKKIGAAPLDSFNHISHQIPMLSLENINNFKQLTNWEKKLKKNLKENKIEYICEWKIDGLSISLLYENSQLTKIGTRGDGYRGEDVSFNKNLIKNIPFFLQDTGNYEIRGELFMTKKDFLSLNQELKQNNLSLLSNPRNAAAGAIMSLTPLKQNLNFIAYTLYGKTLKTQEQCLNELTKMGFLTSSSYVCSKTEELWKLLQEKETEKEELEFASDGIVIKLNKHSHYSKIGRTSRFPRWAVAFKFTPTTTYTNILSINTEVSKNGKISYIANLKPITLLGSKIKKVTLHNHAFIREKKINIGDEIIIKKAGDVVPQIVQTIKLENNENVWSPPDICPSCFKALSWDEKQIFQWCNNKNCLKKNIKFLTFFASKNGMDIEGLNEKTIEKLFNFGVLTKVQDFFNLEKQEQKILSLPGIKQKTLNNIFFAINKAKKRPLHKFLSSFSIPTLGLEKAKKITSFYTDIEAITNLFRENKWDNLEQIVGTKTTQEIKSFWSNPEKKEMFLELKKILFH